VDDESLNIENEETPTVAKPAAKLKKKIVAPSIPKYKFRNDELVDCITVQKKKPSFTPDEKYFTDIVSRIEEKFKEFRIEGQIINILKGPVVDTFELEMGAGVKVSKVISITEDLGLALYGAPIRMVYPLRGRTTIGIEVPRNPREIIYLDDVFRSPEFARSQARLPLVMGRDAFGNFFAEDLTNMPHMLVAGATGSGKSVFINTLLVSLLIKKSPDEMKLLLIDPKQLELALYAGLPHLLLPVVTDAQTASHSLMWACQEMERRYSILKEFGVRNIDGFNEKLPTAGRDLLCKIQGYYDDEDSSDYRLPYIVIIVDEFSDLILSKAGKAIEGNICRLAAKARAAGIHLIIATQRPSVDVVTGLIKSNFPTRVSFKVTTSIDSRTILNTIGAEKLLGNGDMLYKRGIDTFRIHSSYIGETEIETLMNKITTIPARYCSKAVDFIENGEEGERSYGGASWTGGEDSDDELFDEAVQVVTDSGLASASLLQRRLKVGYNRAANLIEIMEDKGIVGPGQGSKPRKVLISSAE
jgi:S-DNA-T family DNA segregation ATPase FtsK/SpoIIIE